MKTWIIDWGKGTRDGSRYALFQCAGDKDDALMELDHIAARDRSCFNSGHEENDSLGGADSSDRCDTVSD